MDSLGVRWPSVTEMWIKYLEIWWFYMIKTFHLSLRYFCQNWPMISQNLQNGIAPGVFIGPVFFWCWRVCPTQLFRGHSTSHCAIELAYIPQTTEASAV
jgi:hypothetical protein